MNEADKKVKEILGQLKNDPNGSFKLLAIQAQADELGETLKAVAHLGDKISTFIFAAKTIFPALGIVVQPQLYQDLEKLEEALKTCLESYVSRLDDVKVSDEFRDEALAQIAHAETLIQSLSEASKQPN